MHLPRIDWWITEITVANPRGTADGWNRVHPLLELLALCFRAFKSGNAKLYITDVQQSGHFGHTGRQYGGLVEPLAIGHNVYNLGEREIPHFVRFWKAFRHLMEEDRHYLQLPIRRLRMGGARRQQEDALVDYVVGLEALLGTKDERAELSYRFRVRGAVVLAATRGERKQHLNLLKKLYDLRSLIVHGQPISSEILGDALPTAEDALRRVWAWYFKRWGRESDNQAAVDDIDRKLVN